MGDSPSTVAKSKPFTFRTVQIVSKTITESLDAVRALYFQTESLVHGLVFGLLEIVHNNPGMLLRTSRGYKVIRSTQAWLFEIAFRLFLAVGAKAS
jgi:hypothetical protein